MEFSEKVIKFCDTQHYTRTGAATEEEFSQVAFRLFGTFFLSSMSLEEIVTVSNCMILARVTPEATHVNPEPVPSDGRFRFECEAAPDTVCGRKGIPHRMLRHSCYSTRCINDGCGHKI